MKIRISFPVLVLCVVMLGAAGYAYEARQQAARKRLEAFVAAFNAGHEEAWRDFISAQWKKPPPAVDPAETEARRLGMFRMVHGDLGGMRIHEITSLSDSEIVALAQGTQPSGPLEWISLRLIIDASPPYLLAGVGIQPTQDPTLPLPTGELTDAVLADYMNAFIDRLVARGVFSGAVLVARDGVPVYTRVAGEACRRYAVKNRLDTKFNLGSMNKMFTGVAIAQLAEQGRLSFDDTVGTFLPDYPNPAVRARVTIRHLLTHTSGLGDYWDPLFAGQFWKVRSVQDYADLFARDSLLFEPGDHFQYSNAGPIVLGLIIEKISGQDYHDYIREHVTGPAGMTSTDCYEIDRPVENLAIGYTTLDLNGERGDGSWRSNLFLHAVRGGPAGGGYSTVEDLLAFANALRQGTILSTAYVDTVITGKVAMYDQQMYGFLFGDETLNGHRIVGHNGGAPGINGVLDIYWGEPFTVAVLANQDDAAVTVARQLKRLLTGADEI